MVGGATCMALGPADAYVTPTMARPGDRIVVTKGAAIEATALFAATFPTGSAAGVGADVVRRADALFEQMTVVPEARVAAAFGLRDRGVTSMHDATEGGVLGGLLEVAVGLRRGHADQRWTRSPSGPRCVPSAITWGSIRSSPSRRGR